MTDHTILFELTKSAEHAGYDFSVSVPGGTPVFIARNIPDVRAALVAIGDAFTAPLVDKDRLDLLEESSAAISGLLDQVAELESGLETMRAQQDETNKALIRMMGGGGGTVVANNRAPKLPPPGDPAVDNLAGLRFVEEGFAGNFRRPLSESVHGGPSGHFPGGAFRPGGHVAPRTVAPMIEETREEEL